MFDHLNKPLGHYQIISVLGQGGMGIVYLAQDCRLKRKVAIKRLKTDLVEDEKDSQRNKRLQYEATSLAQLNHPNIVQIYDIIHETDEFALVMEYIEGETLNKHIKEHKVSVKQRLVWLHQISQGLTAAHQQGLIHRDLKADNILINRENVAKITDFGIAKNTQSDDTDLTVTGKLLGSYSALSPEQALGHPIDERSDLFSFGILAFKLLCGCHPFGDSTNQNIVVQNILHRAPLPADKLNPTLDEKLVTLMNQLLMKQPQLRPTNTQRVTEALQNIIENCDDDSEPNFSDTIDIAILEPSIEASYQYSPSINQNQELAAKPRGRVLITSLIFTALLLSFVSYWQLNKATAPTNLYVAVLPPLINDSEISTEQQHLLADTFSNALQQHVIHSNSLHLVSKHNAQFKHRDYSQIANALSADVLIETVLTCNARHCEVELNRIETTPANQSPETSQQRWAIKSQQVWPMIVDKQYLNTAADVQHRLTRLFPSHIFATELNPLSEKEYQQFLRYRHAIINQGQDSPELWNTLLSLKNQYGSYLPYYQLMSYLGGLLYDDSGDESYLQALSQLFLVADQRLGSQLTLTIARLEIAQRQQDFKLATELVESISQQSDDTVLALSYRGLLANYQGDYQQANHWYQQALALRPSTLLWYRIANNHFYQGNNAAALEALDSLLIMDKYDVNAKILMALVYLLDGRLDEAIGLYDGLIAISPKSQFFSNIGLAYELLGNYSKAEDNFIKAVAISPSNTIWRLNLAGSLQLQGKVNQAAMHYQQVIEESNNRNNDWVAQRNLSEAHVQLGNIDMALQALHRSLRLAGDNAEVLFNAALVYSLAKQWPVALSYIEQSLSQNLSPIWYRLAWFDNLCSNNTEAFNRLLSGASSQQIIGEKNNAIRCINQK